MEEGTEVLSSRQLFGGCALAERRIAGKSDMLEIERVITAHLKGEGGRCAFLRSAPYIRLRVAALYTPLPEPLSAHCGRLKVSLACEGGLPVVRVLWMDHEVYLDEPRKRPRSPESI